MLFRRRFDTLRLAPLLNYSKYRKLEDEAVFRFTGEIESITGGSTLWVRGEDLTIPVSLEKTKCFLLPVHEGDGVPEAPEQVRWNRVSTLSEGAKVFIGGLVKMQDNRMCFVTTKEKPLMVVFYNCPDSHLTDAIIRAARTKSEYWNNITPISIVIGALILIYFSSLYLNRPAFRLTVIASLVAIFIPILPVFPPGLLLTILYRRLSWYARKFRGYWDIARLPMRYLQQGSETAVLSTGETYGLVKINSLDAITAAEGADKNIPFLIPENTGEKNPEWHFFGVINENNSLPQKSKDPFVSYGILPAPPALLARRYAIKAYAMEVFAWIFLIAGIAVNIIFIFLILYQLGEL